MARLARLAVCIGGALMVLTGLRLAAGLIYAPHVAVPDAVAAPVATAQADPRPADPQAGQTVFNRCSACHAINGPNRIGPHLDGIVGREKASLPDFAYSPALRAMAGQVWTPEALDAFLRDTRGYAPGTRMAFAGIASAQDRADLIAYLQSAP